MVWIAAAVLWGIAEASVFFIVPDVLLTVVVLRNGWREAAVLAMLVALAAAATGAVMWYWGSVDVAVARTVMLRIPAIGPDLLARVGREMNGWWPLHLLAGALSGVPYKLYAIEAGARHIDIKLFVIASFVARLARFWFSIGVTAAAAHLIDRLGRPHWKAPVLACGWCALYAVYFTIRANAS